MIYPEYFLIKLGVKNNNNNNKNSLPLHSWLKELHQEMITTNQHMALAILDPPILGERNSRSLRALLMPSIPPTPQDAHTGSFKCQKPRCIICQQHLVKGQTFTSQRTSEAFHIRHRLTCTTPNVIYILHCNKCIDTQYIGETGGTL